MCAYVLGAGAGVYVVVVCEGAMRLEGKRESSGGNSDTVATSVCCVVATQPTLRTQVLASTAVADVHLLFACTYRHGLLLPSC